MPAGQFFQELTVNSDGDVLAAGPLDHVTDKVVEMCVWVYQRSANGHDAIANAMNDGPGLKMKMSDAAPAKNGGLKIVRTKANRPMWRLKLDDRMNKKADFTAGSATALAIGVFIDGYGKERVVLWSEPVELKVAPSKGASAKRSTAKRSTAKRSTAKAPMAKRMSMKR
jgi:hypothetical protein